jgi:prolyl oligopeptidase
MILRRLSFVSIAALFTWGCAGPTQYPDRPLAYPKANKVDQVDDYHGTKVADPYRWLEDDNSIETRSWVDAENKVTFGYLNEIPARAKIKRRLTKIWDYEKYGVPFKEGGRYFFTKNDGLQNQAVVYSAERYAGQRAHRSEQVVDRRDGRVGRLLGQR